MITETVARKCIACGHDNGPGSESCSACGSSLDLSLCPACEAINGAAADRCHACGEVFTRTAGPRPIEGKVLRVLQETYVPNSVARRRRRYAMFVGVMVGMLTLPVYLLVSGLANRVGPVVAQEQQAGVQREASATATTAAKTQVSGSVVAGGQTAPASRLAAPVTGVTHTRRADAPAVNPVVKTVAQEKTASIAPAPTPTVATEKAAAAAGVTPRPTAMPETAQIQTSHVRVTHTEAAPADAAPADATAPAAAVAAIVNSVSEPSASAGKGRSPDCDARVVALGLCKSNGKGGEDK